MLDSDDGRKYLQEEFEEGNIFSNQTYTINASGITPSLRKGKDGISIFILNISLQKIFR